eukprot:7944656-Pyramimonas_sp.AAC.1
MDQSDTGSAGIFSRRYVSHLQDLREVRDHLVNVEVLEPVRVVVDGELTQPLAKVRVLLVRVLGKQNGG